MMQPPVVPEDAMATDDAQGGSQEEQLPTQTLGSQPATLDENHLWGYLQPCNPHLRRIDFWKTTPKCRIGRNNGPGNEVVLPGLKISNFHCTITWDGKEDVASSVVVHDLSSNGTYINSAKIGKDRTCLLREGNEIAFGSCQQQPDNPLEDYRFVYRHLAAGSQKETIFNFYDLGHELGKGSFATVYKAISRETGVWYAVKMIHKNKLNRTNDPTNPNNNQVHATFQREVKILGRLHHPNICQFKEAFFGHQNIYLILEHIDGGDLLEYIIKNNGIAEPMAKHFTYQLCDALAYIHSLGVTHRDLKPENVLLTSDNPPVVKVADFGLAKVVDTQTMLRTMCGTPSYLAPEVVNETNEGYDSLVDSWSVGVIVYCMLMNAAPFIDNSRLDTKENIRTRTIDWDSMSRAGISREARDFIRRLLEYEPKRRMTLAQGLHHAWLQSHVPIVVNNQNLMAAAVPEAEMDDVSAADRSMDDDTDAANDHANEEGSSSQGQKLVRRSSLTLAQAEHEDPVGEGAGAGPSNLNKRKVHPDSDLQIVPEEGKSDTDSDSHKLPIDDEASKQSQGKSRSAPRRTRAPASEGIDEAYVAQKPRRSTRTPQKAARRA